VQFSQMGQQDRGRASLRLREFAKWLTNQDLFRQTLWKAYG
jgi:hypothetical protein